MVIEKEMLELLVINRKAKVDVKTLRNTVSSTKCISNQPVKSLNQSEVERTTS